MNIQKPICVDLDGTLIRNDITLWSVKKFVKKNPLNYLKIACWFLYDHAYMKKKVAQEVPFDSQILDYNKELIDFLAVKREEGIPLFLATASDEIYANKVADELGIFDGVFASNGEISLAAEVKAQTLCMIFGEKGFIYAGNSKDDLKVWDKSAECILVNPSKDVLKKMEGKKYRLFD